MSSGFSFQLRHVQSHGGGAVFRSHLDGNMVELTPERAVAIQEALGSDVAMVLDHVVPLPNDADAVRNATDAPFAGPLDRSPRIGGPTRPNSRSFKAASIRSCVSHARSSLRRWAFPAMRSAG